MRKYNVELGYNPHTHRYGHRIAYIRLMYTCNTQYIYIYVTSHMCSMIEYNCLRRCVHLYTVPAEPYMLMNLYQIVTYSYM